MQDAFLVGVFSYLLNNGIPQSNSTNWSEILKKLNFDQTDWNFRTWVKSLSGQVNTMSKRIAENIFSEVFRNTKLPSSTSNLSDHFKGNQASITIEFAPLTPKNHPARSNRHREVVY